MMRAIRDFERDVEGDWVAVLDCEHGQHVRHKPPFIERAWTQSASGRQGQLGKTLDCLKCDRLEFPERVLAYRRTKVFDAGSVPKGLLRSHATARGVWGKLHVEQGEVRYCIEAEGFHPREQLLTAGEVSAIAPEVYHHVELNDDARFFVEFYKAAK